MMRGFVSRRFGPWRAGVSFPLSTGTHRRGRPVKALASPSTRPTRFYYGVALSGPAIEEEPERHHKARDPWTIIKVSVWLVWQLVVWIVIIAGMALGAISLLAGARSRRT
jgi:hypothetical protein